MQGEQSPELPNKGDEVIDGGDSSETGETIDWGDNGETGETIDWGGSENGGGIDWGEQNGETAGISVDECGEGWFLKNI